MFPKILLVVALLGSLLSVSSCQNSPSEPISTSRGQEPTIELGGSDRRPLMVSTDGGLSWTDAAPKLPGHLEGSFLERWQGQMVLATDGQGLFLETEGEWKNIGADLPNGKVNALDVTEERIYAGLYQAGLHVSSDGGQSWKDWTYDLNDHRVMAILPTENRLLVGTDSGISRLREDSRSWEVVLNGVQVVSLEVLDDMVVAGTSRGTLVSTDGGAHFEWVHEAGSVHYTHIVGNLIAEFMIRGPLYMSDDGGATWFQANYGPSEVPYIYEAIAVDGAFLLANNYGVHRSTDGGRNWKLIYPMAGPRFFDLYAVGDRIYGTTRTP